MENSLACTINLQVWPWYGPDKICLAFKSLRPLNESQTELREKNGRPHKKYHENMGEKTRLSGYFCFLAKAISSLWRIGNFIIIGEFASDGAGFGFDGRHNLVRGSGHLSGCRGATIEHRHPV